MTPAPHADGRVSSGRVSNGRVSSGRGTGGSDAGARLLIIADTHVPTRARDLPDRVWDEVDAADIVIHAGDWMDATGIAPESPRFLDVIPLRFGMSQDDHYHVPLLISPFGYSTYRGS